MERKKQHLWIERKHPRLDTEIHCVIGIPGSDLSAGLIRDMSEGGLNISCGRHTLYNILSENRRTPGMVTDVLVEIHFDLQRPGLPVLAVKCKANLVHFERLAEDDFHIGLEFTRMNKATSKALYAHLESAIKKQHK